MYKCKVSADKVLKIWCVCGPGKPHTRMEHDVSTEHFICKQCRNKVSREFIEDIIFPIAITQKPLVETVFNIEPIKKKLIIEFVLENSILE